MKKIVDRLKLNTKERARFKFELVFLLVSLTAVLCCLLPAIRSSGWPNGANFETNTKIQAAHFKQGDLLPIWSTDDSFGTGSPLPLYYHKTFYYMSGTILLITQSLKLSILATISLFMLIGVYGLRFCLRKFTDHKLFLILVPQTLILANYTFTDWLVRDDMAEFAAMMLTPWLIWWCIRLLKDKKFSLSIAPILFLLINAHNIVAVFGMILPAIALAIFLWREKVSGFHKTIKPLLSAIAIFTVMILPMLILELLFLRHYNPSKITQAGYSASNNFRLFGDYIYHRDYVWLNAPGIPSVQIDFSLLIPIALISIAGVISIFIKSWRQWLKKNIDFRIVLFLVASLTIFTLFQLNISRPLYEHFHVLQYLQFPWRLLVYITILLILLISYVVTRFRNRVFLSWFAIIWLAGFILMSPAFKTLKHQYAPYVPFSYNVPSGQTAELKVLIGGIGEYLPRVYEKGKEIGTLDVIVKYSNDHSARTISGGPCTIAQQPQTIYESLSLRFTVNCASAAQIALPISYNDFTDIKDITNNRRIAYTRTDLSDPRIIISMPKTDNTNLLIRLPSVIQVIKKIF